MPYTQEHRNRSTSLREAAKRAGLRFYYTGVPCRNGHDDKRSVSSGACCACNRARVSAKYHSDAEYQEKCKAVAVKHRPKQYATHRERYRSDPEFRRKIIDRQQSYLRSNPTRRECVRKIAREWAARNRDCLQANGSLRRARKRQSASLVLSSDSKRQLRAIFNEARSLTADAGVPYEVDHQIPLAHPLVCGLHVPWNLQVITRTANREKHNHFDPCEWTDAHPLIGKDIRPLFAELAKDLA